MTSLIGILVFLNIWLIGIQISVITILVEYIFFDRALLDVSSELNMQEPSESMIHLIIIILQLSSWIGIYIILKIWKKRWIG